MKLKGNQEGKDPQYLYYPTGVKKALLIHILGRSECAKCWQEEQGVFTDKNKVYRRI